MKTICIGGAGFIGSHLADYLIEKGHQVIVVDNLSTGDLFNINPQAFFIEADIRNLDELEKIFQNAKPDWVFHLAANARTQLSVDNPMYDMECNVKGTLNVLLASKKAGVKRLIQSSSCILNAPNTPYYVSKLASEEYTQIFNKIYDLSTVSLRYSNVYGSIRQSEKGTNINALASLKKAKREDGCIYITGTGEQVRDWSHVTDICRANLIAANSDKTGVFDICTGVQTSMNEVAKYFNCPIQYIPLPPGDAPHLKQDPTKAKTELRYEYSISLDEKSLEPYIE